VARRIAARGSINQKTEGATAVRLLRPRLIEPKSF
jgi:hypothetical protein